MNVEFFHSVMCGHCFIMSDRIRRIVEEYPEINIIHRAFPLRWDDKEDTENFESKEELEKDFRRKWEVANKIDDKHRFNVDGLTKMDFPMPTSRLPMLAIQAAVLAGGDEWDLFDQFQTALYVHNQNISDEDVIADIIMDAGVNFSDFLTYYENPKTEEMIQEDFQRAKQYNIDLIPAMVIEGKHAIIGTKRYDLAVKLLLKAAKEEGFVIQ